MRRIRMYGKPLPAQRDVKATLKFFELANKGTEMKIEITRNERLYLLLLLNADLKVIRDAEVHAQSHGSDYKHRDIDVACSIRIKIDNAIKGR